VMGALSALIVTACVAPALVGALLVISQGGDVVRGALALFAMSLGMGTPLLIIGTSAGKLLPKAGAWMDTVKQLFGALMLGVAAGALTFARVANVADLDRAVSAAGASGRAVMLDFYADWCASCEEMERYTFTSRKVRQALAQMTLLRADVTANDEDDQALLK